MGSPTRSATVELRRRVVEAALECFSERGYGAVSIEMIRDASNVSVGSLYHHFDNKAGVATAVFAEAIRRYHEALAEAISGDPKAEQGVRSLVEAHHGWVAANPDWARFMMSNGGLAEIKAEAADHDAANDQLIVELVEWARPLMDSGRLAALEPLVFMSVLFGPSYFHTRLTLRRSPDTPNPEAAADFAAAAWRTLRGPAQPATS